MAHKSRLPLPAADEFRKLPSVRLMGSGTGDDAREKKKKKPPERPNFAPERNVRERSRLVCPPIPHTGTGDWQSSVSSYPLSLFPPPILPPSRTVLGTSLGQLAITSDMLRH